MQLSVYSYPLICTEHHFSSEMEIKITIRKKKFIKYINVLPYLWSLIEVIVQTPKLHKRLVWTWWFVAIYTPNCHRACMKQSVRQNWNWCSRTHCLCYSSCSRTCRNCHNRHFPTVRMSKEKFQKLISDVKTQAKEIITLTREQDKQALICRKSFGTISMVS